MYDKEILKRLEIYDEMLKKLKRKKGKGYDNSERIYLSVDGLVRAACIDK